MDRVPYEFLKNASCDFMLEMARIYKNMLNTGEVGCNMEKTVIFPIHKKGNVNTSGNYRGISFMNTISKTFMGIIKDRITNWINENNVLDE